MKTNENEKGLKFFWNNRIKFHNKLLLIGVLLFLFDYIVLYKIIGENPQLYPHWMWVFYAIFSAIAFSVFTVGLVFAILSLISSLPKNEIK